MTSFFIHRNNTRMHAHTYIIPISLGHSQHAIFLHLPHRRIHTLYPNPSITKVLSNLKHGPFCSNITYGKHANMCTPHSDLHKFSLFIYQSNHIIVTIQYYSKLHEIIFLNHKFKDLSK